MKTTLLVGVISLFVAAGWAETPGSLPLLKIAPDARSAALGEAGVAGSMGAMAAFHNPALLAFSDQSQAAFAYTDWLLDLTLQSGALLLHYPRITAALSFNVYNVPGIERRDAPMDNPISTFMAHDLMTGLSLAYQWGDRLALGLTGRMLYQQIYVDEAFGFSADLGAAYRMSWREITIAAVINNLGKMDALQQEESPLPGCVQIGLAGLLVKYIDFGLRGLTDAQVYFEDDVRWHVGLEGFWRDYLFLRAGYQSGSELRRYSGGAGVAWKRYTFDYAYQPFAEDFEASHRFTLGIKF